MSPFLTPCTPHSYDVDSLRGLVDWLAAHDFDPITDHPDAEYARMQDGHSRLVIVYHTGRVVVAGHNQPSTLQLLAALVSAPAAEQEVLPW